MLVIDGSSVRNNDNNECSFKTPAVTNSTCFYLKKYRLNYATSLCAYLHAVEPQKMEKKQKKRKEKKRPGSTSPGLMTFESFRLKWGEIPERMDLPGFGFISPHLSHPHTTSNDHQTWRWRWKQQFDWNPNANDRGYRLLGRLKSNCINLINAGYGLEDLNLNRNWITIVASKQALS